jgi:hypothetical protein
MCVPLGEGGGIYSPNDYFFFEKCCTITQFRAISCDSAFVFGIYSSSWERGSVVCWSAVSQARGSQVRFPVRSVDYFHFTESFQPQYGPGVD